MDNSFHLILTTIVFVIVLFLYIANNLMCRYKFDPFDPFILISGLYLLIFLWAPSVWISRGQTSYQGVEVMAYLPKGNAVFILGYICFVIGSYVSRKKWNYLRYEYEEIEVSVPHNTQKIAIFGWMVFGISIILGLLYYRLQGKSFLYMLTLGQRDSEISDSGMASSFLFLSCFIRSAIPGLLIILEYSKCKKITKVMCAMLTILITITTGSRNLTIATMLSIVVYYYLRKRKRPKLISLIIAFILLYLFVGFVGIFRGDMLNGGVIKLSEISSDNLMNAFMYNVEIFFPFYNLVEAIPKYASFHYGLGVLNIPIQFIPHFLWPNKPATLGTSSLSTIYGNSFGGAAYPNIGTFYYEFGMLGVIVFMYLFGYLVKKKYYLGTSTNQRFRLMQYAMTFGYLFQFVCRSSLSSWAIDIIFMFGPIWILKKYYRIYP